MEKIKTILKIKIIITIAVFSFIFVVFCWTPVEILSILGNNYNNISENKEILAETDNTEADLSADKLYNQKSAEMEGVPEQTLRTSMKKRNQNSNETKVETTDETKMNLETEVETTDEINGSLETKVEITETDIQGDIPEDKPEAVFEASTMELCNLKVNFKYKYSVDGGATYNKFTVTKATDDGTGSRVITGVTEEYGIWVVCVARNSEYRDSKIQKITVTKAAKPRVTVINATADDGLGKVVGVNTDMKYRIKGSNTWYPVAISEVLELKPGNYELYVVGKGTVLPSDTISIQIDKTQKNHDNILSGDISKKDVVEICKILSLIAMIYIIVMCARKKY